MGNCARVEPAEADEALDEPAKLLVLAALDSDGRIYAIDTLHFVSLPSAFANKP